jgi:tetratricopeptide (TPR) repeat protein
LLKLVRFLVLQGVGWSASEPESLLQFLEHLSKGVGEDSEGAETNTMKEISFVKGQLAVEMNEPKAALQHFVHFHNATKRSKLSNDVILAASLAHLGNALVMNERYEDSLSYFRECNSILETESYFDMGLPLLYLGFALWALGHSTMNFGRLSEADDVCSEAVRLTEPPGRL